MPKTLKFALFASLQQPTKAYIHSKKKYIMTLVSLFLTNTYYKTHFIKITAFLAKKAKKKKM